MALRVSFTDTSTNTPTSWLWNFGDGGTSTAQNPVHDYTTVGTYTVALTATNSAGSNTVTKSGAVSVTASATVDTPTDTTAPTAPTGVTTSGATQTAFTVYWTGSSDAVGVTGYEGQVNGVVKFTTDSAARSAPVTGLAAGTTYTVQVRAFDAAGNYSALSTAISATTASASGSISAPTNPTGSPSGSWSGYFTDNFDTGTTADSTYWRRNRFGGTGTDSAFNPSLEGAAFAPSQVTVSNGQLHFTVASGPATTGGKTYPYISGTVSTEGLNSSSVLRPTFGKNTFVEARIRVPKGAGLWPAFWACVSGTYPPELDMFEFFNTATMQRPQFNYHPIPSGQTGPTYYGSSSVDYTDAFHAFGVQIDGNMLATPWLDGTPYPSVAQTISDLQYFLILNLSVYDGITPPSPAVMDVDYVKFWSLNATGAAITTESGAAITTESGASITT